MIEAAFDNNPKVFYHIYIFRWMLIHYITHSIYLSFFLELKKNQGKEESLGASLPDSWSMFLKKINGMIILFSA